MSEQEVMSEKKRKHKNTHSLLLRQIFGATTLAAPLSM